MAELAEGGVESTLPRPIQPLPKTCSISIQQLRLRPLPLESPCGYRYRDPILVN